VIKLFSLYSRETSYTNTTFNFQDRSKKLKLKHGKVPVGNITVDMVLGGMRGMTGLHNRNLIAWCRWDWRLKNWWLKGRVKAVTSGDCLVITALSHNRAGPPPEKTITFSSLMAPKTDRQNLKVLKERFGPKERE